MLTPSTIISKFVLYSRRGDDSRAIDYLVRVGWQAQQRSAYPQASIYLEQALVRLKNQPDGAERDRKEIVIRTGLADSAMVTKGHAAAEYEDRLTRQCELARRSGDATSSFYSLVGRSVLYAFRLELSRASEISLELSAIAGHARDRVMQNASPRLACEHFVVVGRHQRLD